MLRCLLLLACLTSGWAAAQDEAPEPPDADPFLTQARQAAVYSAETLDSFLCHKRTVRHRRDVAGSPWHDRDTIDAEVAFDRGTGERYRNLTVNGVPSNANFLNLKGSNSLGEFALELRNLFDSIGNDSFRLLKVERRNGQLVRIYAYAVEQAASNWKVEENSQSVTPAFSGAIWIDAESRQVVHLEMRARELPATFPENLVSSVVEYGPITIAGQKPRYLPTGAEVLFCTVEGSCDRNVIQFDNYRQFSAESRLKFTPAASEVAPVSVPPPTSLSIPAPWDPAAIHFDGVAHPRTSERLALELDDERFLIVNLQPPTPFPIHEGDRIQVSTTGYDGRGLIAESISEIARATSAEPIQKAEGAPSAGPDPMIGKARETEAELLRSLPNYLCTENVRRYQSWPLSGVWELLDRLSTDVVYRRESGETYRNVRLNGQLTSRRWEDIGGDVSTGEFGTLLRSLLAEGTARFQFVKNTRVSGLAAAEYTYSVPRTRSDLHVRVDYQYIVPAYSGKIWFDQQLGRVLRLERKVDGIPSKFPLRSVVAKVTFGEIQLRASQTDILPIRVETIVCMRKSQSCSRKIMQFTDYRLFTSDSKLKF